MPDVAVVVVNYGSADLLGRNLARVADDLPGCSVVVVDNFTTREERARVRALADQHGWQALLLEENVGFGSGVNRGVEAVGPGPAHVLLLNPDATVDRASVEGMLAHVDAHPLDLAAPTVRRPDGSTWSTGVDLDLDTGEMRGWHRRTGVPDPSRVQPWLSGACLLLRRDLWDRVGGFDEDYFLYWEDVDLSRRVLEAGGDVVVVPGASAVHDEGATHREEGEDRAKSPTYYYFNTRNRLLFAAKHLSPARRRRWRRSAASAAYEVLMRGGRRQLVRPRSTLSPVLRGTVDGLRSVTGPRP